MDPVNRSAGFIRTPLGSSTEVGFFLSSGSDLAGERDHFEELVRVVNEQLYFAPRSSRSAM